MTFDRVDAIALEAAGISEAVERLTAGNSYVPARGRYPLGAGALAYKLTSHALVYGTTKPPKKRVLKVIVGVGEENEKIGR